MVQTKIVLLVYYLKLELVQQVQKVQLQEWK